MSYAPSESQEPKKTEAKRVSSTVSNESTPLGRWALVILKLDAVAVWLVD